MLSFHAMSYVSIWCLLCDDMHHYIYAKQIALSGNSLIPESVEATIDSAALVSSLFDVYLGEKPVSPTAKESVALGLQALLWPWIEFIFILSNVATFILRETEVCWIACVPMKMYEIETENLRPIHHYEKLGELNIKGCRSSLSNYCCRICCLFSNCILLLYYFDTLVSLFFKHFVQYHAVYLAFFFCVLMCPDPQVVYDTSICWFHHPLFMFAGKSCRCL